MSPPSDVRKWVSTGIKTKQLKSLESRRKYQREYYKLRLRK